MIPSTSVAIADSHVAHTTTMEDYVIVQQPDEIRDDESVGGFRGDGDDDDDDDSYDYCDDVYCQEAQSADDQDDDHSVDLTVGSEPGDIKDSIILTVPTVLMKDLDDAHAAAALARPPDSSEEKTVASAPAENAPPTEPSDKKNGLSPVELEDDNGDGGKNLVEPANCYLASETDKKSMDAEDGSTSQAIPASLSRASNKKRRKKLKLMKKNKAAANAAHSLSGRGPGGIKANKSKKMTRSPSGPTRGASRKVSNIAAVCARETMATYRHEVLCSGMSKQSCY